MLADILYDPHFHVILWLASFIVEDVIPIQFPREISLQRRSAKGRGKKYHQIVGPQIAEGGMICVEISHLSHVLASH